MAVNPFYKNLLGFDPYEEERNRQKLFDNLYTGASSPYEKIGIGIGQIGGALFGGEQKTTTDKNTLDKTFAEVGQQFPQSSPDFWKELANRLPEGMNSAKTYSLSKAAELEAAQTKVMREDTEFYTKNPQQATAALQTLAARIEANPNDKNALRQYNAVANAYQQGFYEDQRKDREAPTTAADRGVYEDFVRQAGGDVYTAGLAFNKYKTDQKQRENTPLVEGNVKSSDISTFIGSVNTNLKPLDVKLRTYNEIRALIKQVADGNTVAVPQLERFMAKAAGDNQLSATEIRQLANSGGLVERTVGGVQKFVLGTPSNEKLKKTVELINSLEDQTAKEYNTSRDKLEATWGTSNLPKGTLDAQLGSRYVPASQREKTNKEATPKPQKMVTKRTASGKVYQVLEDQ